MIKAYKITIPKPCTKDWDQMTKTDQGKHCSSCNKVVIDFTKMKNDEIISILLKNKGKKVCGNFYNTQIERPLKYINVKTQTKWPAIAAMLVAGLFTFNSGIAQAQKDEAPQYHTPSIRVGEKKTEPSKDSLISYSIRILTKEGKQPIQGASVSIEKIGEYISDKNGLVSFSIAEKDIPELIHISFWANGYRYEDIHIKKAKISNSKKIELFMVEEEEMMLRGDISIEETH